jgi:hypothetical protein
LKIRASRKNSWGAQRPGADRSASGVMCRMVWMIWRKKFRIENRDIPGLKRQKGPKFREILGFLWGKVGAKNNAKKTKKVVDTSLFSI